MTATSPPSDQTTPDHTKTPEVASVVEALAPYRGKKVKFHYFPYPNGNNGDRLIEKGAFRALEDAGVDLVEDPKDASLIVMNGGGAMVEFYAAGLDTLRMYLRDFADTPLIVLPQSYKFETLDFPALFADRRVPCTLFARERVSFKTLRGMHFSKNVSIGLDHDMAFRLQGSPFIEDLKARSQDKHILVVERGDVESTTARAKPLPGPRAIKRKIRWLTGPIRRTARKLLAKRAAANASPFTEQAVRTVKRLHPEFADLPVIASDVSDPMAITFDGFLDAINEASVVYTNRLHVGVLSAMLDKPTLIRPASYHKIAGIYELSLASRENVTLISPDDDAPGA